MCPLCAGVDPARTTPLAELLPPGQSRFITTTPSFAAVPTYGCFVPGYVLIVPRTHVLSLGQLGAQTLTEAQTLIEELAGRLQAVYGLPVLGFEYGLNARGVRRIEHAHWHLLPSTADLAAWLDERLAGRPIGALTDLPDDASYIAVRGQDATFTLFDVGDAATSHRRIRLRRTVAALDPRVDDDSWDWAEQRSVELIRATVADLATGSTTTGSKTTGSKTIGDEAPDRGTDRGTERAARP